MRALGVIVAVAVLAGCGQDRDARSPDASTSPTEENASSQVFDALDIRLEFATTEVAPNESIPTTMIVENRSGAPVGDPGCQLGTGAYALVPLDDPDAELWIRPVADCGGRFTMADGFAAEFVGPTFFAHAKTGDLLSPGDYLAVVKIEGRSRPLKYPVTVR